MRGFIKREQLRETPEVHVAGSCIKQDNKGNVKILFARRSDTRELFPGKLEGCGGQLREAETFQNGVKRHFKQELGIEVTPLSNIFNLYEIQRAGKPTIPGIRFLCTSKSTEPPTLINHTEIFWMDEKTFKATDSADFVGDLKQDLISLLDQYRIQSFLPNIENIISGLQAKQKYG